MERVVTAFGTTVFIMFLGTSAGAQPQPPAVQGAKSETTLSDTDKELIRSIATEAVNEYKKRLNASVAPAQGQAIQEKNWAEVTDKWLERLGPYVGQIAATIQKAAPHVYEIMIRQQIATAKAQLVVSWGVVTMLLIYLGVVGRLWKPNENDSDQRQWRFGLVRVVPVILIIANATWGFTRLADAWQMLYNPEYYAIRDILQMALNR